MLTREFNHLHNIFIGIKHRVTVACAFCNVQGLLDTSIGKPLATTDFYNVGRSIADNELASPGREDSWLLAKFKALVDEHYHARWAVSDYAQRLYVSVPTLSRLCQRQVGQSPKHIIQQRLQSEAKRRLIDTRQSLEGIATTLGYKDTAYFCRRFKRMEGVTAGQFRREHGD